MNPFLDFLRKRPLLKYVAMAWAATVLCAALKSFLFINYLALALLFLTPILWLRPLWLLPKGPGTVFYAAPLLLLLVPVVLVASAETMSNGMVQALIHRDRANSYRYSSARDYVRLADERVGTSMAKVGQGLRIGAGGGALAAVLEILGLFCWTRRIPAHRWAIALILFLFGPAVALGIYVLSWFLALTA